VVVGDDNRPKKVVLHKHQHKYERQFANLRQPNKSNRLPALSEDSQAFYQRTELGHKRLLAMVYFAKVANAALVKKVNKRGESRNDH
jgi:hypothetical protein